MAPATLKPEILKPRPATLKKRSEFLRVKGGPRWGTPGFALETRLRPDAPQAPPRFGFTVSKKVGGAVVRNRIRRRLRSAALKILPAQAKAGLDYVQVGRAAGATKDYADIAKDLKWCLKRMELVRAES